MNILNRIFLGLSALILLASSILSFTMQNPVNNDGVNQIIIKSHDEKSTWILDKNCVEQSQTLKLWLEDTDNNQPLILSGLINPADFTLFHPYLNFVYQIQTGQNTVMQLENSLLGCATDKLIAITSLANFLEVPILLDCATSVIARTVPWYVLATKSIDKDCLHKIEMQRKKHAVTKLIGCGVFSAAGLYFLSSQKGIFHTKFTMKKLVILTGLLYIALG